MVNPFLNRYSSVIYIFNHILTSVSHGCIHIFFSFGATSVHIMNQCHRVFIVGYVVPRGSIYRQRLSEKIFQLAAGGLIDKAFGDIYDGVALLAEERGVEVSDPVKLGLFHLQGAFFVWVVFLPVACLAFLVEFLIPKINKSKEP